MDSANYTSRAESLPTAAIDLAARMFDAARQGNIELLRQALPAGLPANLRNGMGDSLLMLAAYNGHANVVKLLLDCGADPNQLNDRQQSPLAGAVFKMEDNVINVLLEGGADPDHGHPSALECVTMFKQETKWKNKFEEEASARGKVVEASKASI
ncbi:ankyrin repeat-containing domain protein [Bombardia bombarda]|uniref:Ankyrin repeat-containing domain protein n=1 Tax=Bombardia bombarda TaxID=252184 RepID=A0AA40C4Z9_9PEZI|nr:ankyrin repeat-containing domain protein [Bombardia bombarda]